MGKATTQIETRLTGVDATAAAFASVKRRFAAFDNKSALNKNLNPFAGLGQTKTGKGVMAGFGDVGMLGKALGGGASMAGRLAGSLAKGVAAAAAIGGVVAGIVAKKGFDAIMDMDALGDAAAKVGLTANEYKRFSTVMEKMGLDGKELAGSVFPKMNKALGEKSGQDALKKIGLSFDTLKTMSPEERFKTIGSAIADVGNDLERAQLETDLFGKAGAELDVMFRQGGKAFSESFGAVGRLAGELDEGGVAAAGRFADSWAIAKDRATTTWQNMVGGMLKSFEAKFGPIDRWLLGMWEDMAASAKIVWLELSTNGPAVFQTFFRNAGALASGFFKNWGAGFSWLWDSIIGAATGLAIGFSRLGKNIWAALKGDETDWAGVTSAFKAAIPDFGDLATRLGVELEKTQLIDLSAEKAKIREASAARKLQDKDSLAAAERMQRQTSNNMSDGLVKGAEALKEAVKDAEGVAMGSYEAFKLVMGRTGATQGALVPSPLSGQGLASASASGEASGSFGAMLTELRNIVTAIREGDRDRTVIRDAVESLGVA